MKIALIVIGVLVLGGLLFGGKLMGTRNDLVQQREAIAGAWSQVDVDLQRRADLIPNLVNTVKGFAAQEKEVLNNLANARAGMLNAKTPQEKINANSQLDSALWPVARGGRELSAADGRMRTFMRLAGRTGGHGKSDRAERRRIMRLFSATTQALTCSRTTLPHRCSGLAATMPTSRRNRRRVRRRR